MKLLLTALLLAGAPAKKPAAPAPAAAAPAAADSCDGAKATKEEPCHHPSSDPSAAATSTDETVLRGEKLKGLPAVELAALLKSPSDFDGKTVALKGTVRKACERKGCWMELATAADAKGPGVRVTFKDYGFFVPLDSAGRKAQVEGQVKVAELSDETAKHYESEGAQVPRGKDGKPREVQLVALGVELRK
ncbi:MAG: DUF4920 domain-containing protein [Myxococcaceae bacterium]|nr:DUF4920 domain-containing protein [Myxococcaceae bacterium]